MIRLSSTLIYDSIRIAEWLKDRPVSKDDSVSFLTRLLLTIDAQTILDWLCTIKAAELDGKFYKLTDDYRSELEKLHDDSPYYLKVRIILKRYVLNNSPTWSSKIIYGRKEVFLFLTEDEQRCFIEARLMNEYDANTINWWDNLANRIRANYGINLNEEGRTGESLTMAFERQRTGFEPKWSSIDSNLLGYDIDSRVSRDDPTRFYIEAKTTILSDNEAVFYISRREWETAEFSKHYSFYIWSISQGKTKLLLLSPNDVRPHIPDNNGSGTWESVKIKINSFIKTHKWEEIASC